MISTPMHGCVSSDPMVSINALPGPALHDLAINIALHARIHAGSAHGKRLTLPCANLARQITISQAARFQIKRGIVDAPGPVPDSRSWVNARIAHNLANHPQAHRVLPNYPHHRTICTGIRAFKGTNCGRMRSKTTRSARAPTAIRPIWSPKPKAAADPCVAATKASCALSQR